MLRLAVLLSCWLQAYHSVLAADTVVEDTDSSIVYQPPSSWHSNMDSCPNCLNPGGTASYHEAIHPAVALDPDDVPSNSAPSSSAPEPPASPAPPDTVAAAAAPVNPPPKIPQKSSAPAPQSTPKPATAPADDDDDGAPGGDGDGDADDKGGSTSKSGSTPGTSGKGKRSILRREVNRRLDPDDPGFKDPNVTLSFNFTGSAIYVYGIQPLGVSAAATNHTPTNMNLTFMLDGVKMSNFNSIGSSPTPQFSLNQAFFSRSNLAQAPHQLVVHVGQNSTFIFDYLVYTNSTGNSTTTMPATPLAQQTPSPTVDPKVKKHNIATFAGAVGGSVGVLALFSLGLAISIIRRRRLAARRDQLDRESLHTNASDDSPNMTPNMSGPAPFVPRFFPDTVIPPDPPTYTAALANNPSTLLASLSSTAYPDSTRSYADVPPSTPPPPLDDATLILPPPPFPMPVSIRLPGLSAGTGLSSRPVENPLSQILDSVVRRE
ncbi:hypothetical protein GALMADRAFT_244968 [Galerina marginata CBS 339.88]|uniref:Uncharacterized protein n=1 Tax=Galerina marginata (strain CBS 339.88) TaxID=685588 RepID=A0A067T4B4_GALM3|nr:hypothetical protein GALMADRAFT_244968 [Galerina marginata CBS 339.88]